MASFVRVRAEANTTAETLTQLPIGATLLVVEKSAAQETIGGKADFWYKVQLSDGRSGWVFGAFTLPFDGRQRDAVNSKIIADRLAVENLTFVDWSDLETFVTRSISEATDRSILPKLELARLVALRKALESIPYDKFEDPTIKAWLERHKDRVVSNDPAGVWIVTSETFWALHDKYKATPLAETLAWEAASNPLPGECEGYTPCHVGAEVMTRGRYLELYPTGKHADEALAGLAEAIGWTLEGEAYTKPADLEPAERAALLKDLGKLKAAGAKATGPKQKEFQRVVDKALAYYR